MLKLVAKEKKKNPAATALGRLRISSMSDKEREEFHRKGGQAGGKARAAKLSPEQRRAIAKKAARASAAARRKRKGP